MSDPDAWRADAACLGMDLNVFFPSHGVDARPAKQVCESCDVRAECLAANINEAFGIWGGFSETERRSVRRTWRPGMPLPPVQIKYQHGHLERPLGEVIDMALARRARVA